jgi:hypothetical protein
VNEALNVTGWIHGLRALSPPLKLALNEVAVMTAAFTPSLPGLSDFRGTLQQLTRESNEILMQVVDNLVSVCRDGAKQRCRSFRTAFVSR